MRSVRLARPFLRNGTRVLVRWDARSDSAEQPRVWRSLDCEKRSAERPGRSGPWEDTCGASRMCPYKAPSCYPISDTCSVAVEDTRFHVAVVADAESSVARAGNDRSSVRENLNARMDPRVPSEASRPMHVAAHAWSSATASESCARQATFDDGARYPSRSETTWPRDASRAASLKREGRRPVGRRPPRFHDDSLTLEV
jgi:hypothetical protein